MLPSEHAYFTFTLGLMSLRTEIAISTPSFHLLYSEYSFYFNVEWSPHSNACIQIRGQSQKCGKFTECHVQPMHCTVSKGKWYVYVPSGYIFVLPRFVPQGRKFALLENKFELAKPS